MHCNELLIFDVSSEYGHFRKFNTTSSPLTYSIPTRTAIVGLIAAIIGIEREISPGKFREGNVGPLTLLSKDKADIAVQLLSAVKKVSIGFNLLDTEKQASSFFNIKQRTQIEYELLKNPCFRLFVRIHDSAIFKDLIDRVRENRTHFSPYMGLAQFTASISYKALSPTERATSGSYEEVVTAINLSRADENDPIRFNYNKNFRYNSDTMPVEMLANRVVTEFAEVIIEADGKPISVKSDNILQTEGYGKVLFL